jgi:hypothetical protein
METMGHPALFKANKLSESAVSHDDGTEEE